MSVIGLRVGPFEVESEAFVPEAGRWFRAVRTGLVRKQPAEALVRVLGPDASATERQDLQRIFENLRSLDDPRVPAPIAFYEGIGALAVACVEGTSLDKLVGDRRADALPMSPGTLLDLSVEIAEALQHAHHRGRWHGHLWPGVVVLGADGHLWVWGFGPGPAHEPPPQWAAPERARGQQPGAPADQWALAALIASFVTGQVPWRADDPAAEARKGDPEPIVGPVEKQWPALGRLLRRMLEPMPENRYPSLQPVRQELLALARKAGSTSERHRLGQALADRHRAGEPAAEASAPRVDAPRATPAPAPDAPGAEPRLSARTTPPPAPEARQAPRVTPIPSLRAVLPNEPMAVVRPAVDGEVPVARVAPSIALAPTPAPAPGRAATPRPTPAPLDRTDERLATEVLEDRAATEIVEDRAATEVIDGARPAQVDEREPTEMVEVSDLSMALVAPLEECVEDPISESLVSVVTLREEELPAQETKMPDEPPKSPPKLAPFQPVALPPKGGEDEEDTGDAATVQYNVDQLMTVLKMDELPSTVTPPPAPSAEAPVQRAPSDKPAGVVERTRTDEKPAPPVQRMPSAATPAAAERRSSGPAAVVQHTQPPVAPPIPVAVELSDPANPTISPVTDSGVAPGSPLADASPAPSAAGTAPVVTPVAPILSDPPTAGDPRSGPGGMPTEPAPKPLPEQKPSPITMVAPVLAILLILALVAYTVWNLAS